VASEWRIKRIRDGEESVRIKERGRREIVTRGVGERAKRGEKRETTIGHEEKGGMIGVRRGEKCEVEVVGKGVVKSAR
jgi:hypothetical protein